MPLPGFPVVLQVNVDDSRPARDRFLDVGDLVVRVGALGVRSDFLERAPLGGPIEERNRRPESRHQLAPVDERAAGRAQHDDVET